MKFFWLKGWFWGFKIFFSGNKRFPKKTEQRFLVEWKSIWTSNFEDQKRIFSNWSAASKNPSRSRLISWLMDFFFLNGWSWSSEVLNQNAYGTVVSFGFQWEFSNSQQSLLNRRLSSWVRIFGVRILRSLKILTNWHKAFSSERWHQLKLVALINTLSN